MHARFVVTTATLACLLVPITGQAQDKNSSARRMLNGHTFIPSSQIDDPFITTMVRTRTGAGIASKVARDLEDGVVDSLLQVLEGDLAFIALDFEYQHALTDWLALGGTGSAAARIGTGAQSVIAQGITSIFSFQVQARARFLQTEKWMWSANVKLQPTTQYSLEVLDFARRIIEEGQISEDNSLIRSGTKYGGAFGLRGAFAPTSWLGFLFSGDLGYADTFEEGGRENVASSVGGLMSLDLNALRGTPVGFTLSVEHDRFVQGNSDIADHVTGVGLGIAYTGRSDFSIGLEGTFLRLPLLESDRTASAMIGGFNLKYFF